LELRSDVVHHTCYPLLNGIVLGISGLLVCCLDYFTPVLKAIGKSIHFPFSEIYSARPTAAISGFAIFSKKLA